MRIAMIGQKGLPASYGGVERHVHELAVRLTKAGHQVTAYGRAWYTQGQPAPEGVTSTILPSLKTKHLDTVTHTLLASIHAIRGKFDVIHYHGVGPALLAWIPRLFAPRSKVVVTFHSIDRHHQKWGWFAKLALRLGEWSACRFAHNTIVVSKSLQNYCLNEFGVDATYVPNGTTLPDLKNTGDVSTFNLIPQQYLLMVSRLIPHKAAHLLIEAFVKLKDANAIDANLKLVIVGDSVHTDAYVANLKASVSGRHDVVFTGFQSGQTLHALFANSLAVVHPSLSEGLPISVLEAMSFARPVLVSDIAEHLEIIKDGRALFTQNSVRSLSQTLVSFLNRPVTEHKAMGDLNRLIIREYYSWENLVPHIVAVYQNTTPEAESSAEEVLASA